MKKYKEKAKVWIWPGESANWHFVYVDKKHSDEIKAGQKGLRRGFGAVKVRVTLGETTWDTSIFPSKKDETYLLPLKAQVRRAENVRDGEEIEFTIELI